MRYQLDSPATTRSGIYKLQISKVGKISKEQQLEIRKDGKIHVILKNALN